MDYQKTMQKDQMKTFSGTCLLQHLPAGIPGVQVQMKE